MSKNGKTELTSLSTLRAFIDKVGELQLRKDEAKARYDHAREKLEKRLQDTVGIDVWVTGNHHTAALLREKETIADVLDFLDTITDSGLRRELLTVRVGQAKKLLSPADRKQLLVERYREQPTLKVSKVREKHAKRERA